MILISNNLYCDAIAIKSFFARNRNFERRNEKQKKKNTSRSSRKMTNNYSQGKHTDKITFYIVVIIILFLFLMFMGDGQGFSRRRCYLKCFVIAIIIVL